MLNQAIIVGRIYAFEEDGMIIISVTRGYKNDAGEYDNDFIPVKVKGSVQENTRKYCDVGDIVGIKGRLMSSNTGVVIDVDKVTFLSKHVDSEGGEEVDGEVS